MFLALLVLACQKGECPEGEIRDGTDCIPYNSEDPFDPGTVWSPTPGTSWQWQLSGTIDTTIDVEMYDIDLFDTPDATIQSLQADDREVICYFSAGSREEWRADADDFPEEVIGKKLQGWDGEHWLDINSDTVRDIMKTRLDLAVEQGCDGVEPDNVDGYANNTGFPLNATEQLKYNRFLADEAHIRGLSVGLKNDLGQVADLVEWFDWALNEECVSYDECDVLGTFTSVGKSAFHTEYVDKWSDASEMADEVCGVGPNLDTIIKTWDLTAERLPCP